MAPQVKHDGFLVPNAGGEGVLPRMAEVDQIDFNTLSQTHKYSVVEGCKVSVSVTSASTPGGGIAIVNGQLVNVNSASTADLGRGVEQDRFDLIAVGMDGNIKRIDGVPSFDPVFPDPPFDVTILAAVFCPAGASSFSELVIDKRVMAPSALLTKLTADQQLVRNVRVDGSALTNVFSIRGDGYTVWNLDTALFREDKETLRIVNNLNLSGRIQAGSDITTSKDLVALNLVKAKNIFTGTAAAVVGDEPLGALRQDPNGRLYIKSAAGWVEVATVNNTTPVGTIIQSVQVPGDMPAGWVQLNGDTISEITYGALFTLPKMQQYILPGGTVGQRQMALPNCTDRVLLGTQTDLKMSGSNTVQLGVEHMPLHKHNVKVQKGGATSLTGRTEPDGGHSHVTRQDGGHEHVVSDPGHSHEGMDMAGLAMPIIALQWGGKNKLDAEFNDRNHTYSVEAYTWLTNSKTGIKVEATGSTHTHILDGVPPHTHGLTLDGITSHDHGVEESEVGGGRAFSVQQAAFSVFMYIKA